MKTSLQIPAMTSPPSTLTAKTFRPTRYIPIFLRRIQRLHIFNITNLESKAPVHTNTMENGYLDPRKRRLSKTPSKVETFENGCLSYKCGRDENAGNEDFRKRWRLELDNQSPTENENVSFFLRIVWTRIFVSVYVGSKTEAYENGLVWT